MYDLYRQIKSELDYDRLFERIGQLWKIELGQTFAHYWQAAEHVAEILRADGFSDVEAIAFPADGKSIFHDVHAPIAWHATKGRLTLLTKPTRHDPDGFNPGPVIADYGRHPFHLVKGSTATPAEGIECRIFTEAQMRAGEDVRGGMILLEWDTAPRAGVISMLLDKGARGFIADFLKGRWSTPDCIQWVTAATEGRNWNVNAFDRDFIGFSISPRTGGFLRAQAEHGVVMCKVECDGYRAAETFPCVTATVPGADDKEIWALAHLFEPLADDNSLGVMALIENARCLLKKGGNRHTIRLVMSLECFGFSVYAATRSREHLARVLGGMNFDSTMSRPGYMLLCESVTPFAGNLLVRHLADEITARDKEFPEIRQSRLGFSSDDMLLSDPQVGVPTFWAISRRDPHYWHNSYQDMEFLDRNIVRQSAAFNGTALTMMANPRAEYAEAIRAAFPTRLGEIRALMETANFDGAFFRHLAAREQRMFADFGRFMPEKSFELSYAATDDLPPPEEVRSPARDHAASLVFKRLTPGFIFELCRIPRDKHRPLPGSPIYDETANLFTAMDGRKNLAQIIRETEFERAMHISEEKIKAYTEMMLYLSEYGYLKLVSG
ncbi:MAG: DUF4910 domain-containing protein [Lentisphaerae bacterium]|jgi:hypothetical protein|nr:DUF4910 domain-containing protein [Lentisphaerota bacterium]